MMMLIFLPCLIVLTIMVTEIGNLYVAKKELKYALESGALGAVRVWKAPDADPLAVERAARAFVAANPVRGHCVDFDQTILDSGDLGNGSFDDGLQKVPDAATAASVRLIQIGCVEPSEQGWVFRPGRKAIPGTYPAVRLSVSQQLDGAVSEVFGLQAPNYAVTSEVTARSTEDGDVELIKALVVD